MTGLFQYNLNTELKESIDALDSRNLELSQKASDLEQENMRINSECRASQREYTIKIEELQSKNRLLTQLKENQHGASAEATENFLKDICRSVMNLNTAFNLSEGREDEVYELQLRINDLESEILTIRHEHLVEFNQLSSEFQTAVKKTQSEERFAFESKLAAREMELFQQIDELNDQLGLLSAVKSDNLINLQLIDQLKKHLSETQNFVLDQQEIQKNLADSLDRKKVEIDNLDARCRSLQLMLDKNLTRVSHRSFEVH